jgi:hypothetical protein
MRLMLPNELLSLPTDGNGNEAQKQAVFIAPVLARWVRSSQAVYKGKTKPFKVGTLLEEANIITFEEFKELHSEAQKRMREYLYNLNGDGALQILQKMKAFELSIDEAIYFTSGRGWQEVFWECPINLFIDDLNIDTSPPKELPKRTRRKG